VEFEGRYREVAGRWKIDFLNLPGTSK